LRSSNTSLDPWTWRRQAFLSVLAAHSLAACLATSFVEIALAIDPNRAMSQYVRERWGREQGFPRGPVYAIAQSSDGYLWIGTQAGLVRFDGLNFRLVRDVPALLNSESVLGLTPDRDGNLWVRLEGSTLLRYRNGVFDNPTSGAASLNSAVTAMCQANQGELLVSVVGRGTMVYRRGRFEIVADASGLPRSPVLAVAQTPDGGIWAGTRGAGLFRLRQGQTSSVTENLPDPKVNCLLSLANGDLWVGTDNGIARWNGNRLTAAGIPASLRGLQVLAMVKDRDANIWLGTDSGGLLRLNDRGVSSLDKVDDRSREAVTAVFEDREGNVWTGSAGGIERLRDSAFVTYSLPEGLPSDGSKPVFVDSEDRTWFAPVDGGLWWMKEGQHGQVTADGLRRDVVYSIAGNKGELWVGRQRGGLTRLRADGGSITAKTYTKADGLAQDSVFSVYQARDGSVWAGTLSGGVSKLSGGRFTNYTSATGLVSNTVASILESSDGTMWFATPGGLSTLSKGHWRAYTARDGLPSENVNCLSEDSTGVLWIGTAAGLAFRSPTGFQVPAGVPASLREQILGLEEDRYSSLWIATSNHVLRVNREKLLQGALGEGDVREYGLADGLRGVEGVRRDRSVVADPGGRIWFSLNRGISVVDPARLTRSSPAIVHVQTVSTDGSAVSLQGSVHIPGGRQRVTFGYAGLSLSIPERVRFRYRLEGFDLGWSQAVATREAVYTNLSPGVYRFRVIASSPDGAWNSDEAAVAFEVDPLFWQTWWFRASVVMAFAAAILALYRFRLRQLTRRLNVRFEERLAERTRIARELHDTLLQSFHGLLLRFQTVSNLLPERPAEAKQRLDSAIDQAAEAITEGRDAVQQLRSSTVVTNDLAVAVSTLGEELAADETNHNSAVFRAEVEGTPRNLHPILRDEVYRITGEALRNAFRHAQARQIEVEIRYDERQLRLRVRDDGKGIDPKFLNEEGRPGHWGLHGMHERARLVGAHLDVWSEVDSGTEVELRVPASVAYVTSPFRGRSWWSGRGTEMKS
jgi:ligand-binding sensor domain-containing protein/signal transduction histidine kinase